MTKRECLEKTIELWDWLAADRDRYKSNWPGFNGNTETLSRCYCCQYARDQEPEGMFALDCSFCPLIGYAWSYDGKRAPCTLGEAPYEKWCTNAHDPVYARQIADAARKALAELVD